MATYSQISVAPFSSSPNNLPKGNRRTANYHPSVWGHHFLSCDSDFVEVDNKIEQRILQLKEEVRELVFSSSLHDNISLENLNLIDAIQRLGLAYNFEIEIEKALQQVKSNYQEYNFDCGVHDLYVVALQFRLLRQQGHNISCDVFNKFKDANGKFNIELLGKDVKGLLSLYEAAHYGVHGEDVLDEAISFASTQLKFMAPSLSSSLAAQVQHALEHPIHKSLAMIEARYFMDVYQKDDSHNILLLELAKLNFNLLQKMHRKELSGISRWWKDLDLARKLPFARDRMVECYIWILGVFFEPQYHMARKILTKVICLASYLDDTYDLYATLEELVLFTDAIERWDTSASNQLPEYMKTLYLALLGVYSEMEDDIGSDGGSNSIGYAKQAMKQLAKAYFQEAKWFHNGYVPSIEEYMEVASVSSGYLMLAKTLLVCMAKSMTKEDFDWVSSNPLMIRAVVINCRLMNDMAGHEVTSMH